MTSVAIDRIDGLSSSTAIKGPCRVATTANITLTGLKTIDGVTVVAGDRVLVKDQTTPSQNGIYVVDTGPWRRAKDFSNNRDIRKGTRVWVTDGNNGPKEYALTSGNPVVVGASPLAFLPVERLYPALDPTGGALVVVASGQSNMVGYGFGGPVKNNPNVNVWVQSSTAFQKVDMALGWTMATGDQVGTYAVGHSGDPAYIKNNLAVAFCNRLQEETGRPVYLIIEADGGQSIDQWVGTGTASPIYAMLKTSTQAALASLGRTSIDVFLWHQGEANNTGSADIYYANLQKLITQLNAETWMDPTTPFIAGGLVPISFVGAAQRAITWLNLDSDPQTSAASENGLTLEGDGHIDGPSLWEFGYNRYYAMHKSSLNAAQMDVRSTSFNEEPTTFGKYVRANSTVGMYQAAAYSPTYFGFSPQPVSANNYLANGDLQVRLYPASGGITLLRIPATTTDVTMTGMSVTTASGGNFPTFRVFADTARFEGIISPTGNIQPVSDNVSSAGTAGRRLTTVYANNATINTSDEREKREIEAIPDEVLDAWQEVEWVRFRRIDGDRIHTGLIAQRVIAAFESHGLDATEWGVLCYDEWEDDFEDVLAPVTEEDGTVNMVPTGEKRLALAAGNRYGIRYEEALSLEAALMRRTTHLLVERLTEIKA